MQLIKSDANSTDVWKRHVTYLDATQVPASCYYSTRQNWPGMDQSLSIIRFNSISNICMLHCNFAMISGFLELSVISQNPFELCEMIFNRIVPRRAFIFMDKKGDNSSDSIHIFLKKCPVNINSPFRKQARLQLNLPQYVRKYEPAIGAPTG